MNGAHTKIPRIIHQTWKNRTIPEHWTRSHEGWKGLEGFEYRLWTDEDNRHLIATKYPWFLDKYDSYKYPIQRADAIRYFILYECGGVYVDLDIEPKPTAFLKLFAFYEDEKVVLAKVQNNNDRAGQILTNAFMMSQAKQAYWKYVWDFLERPFQKHKWKRFVSDRTYHFEVLFTTGPGIISDSASTFDKKNDIRLIPSDLMQPGTEKEIEYPFTTNESAVTLLKGRSWNTGDSHMFLNMRDISDSIDYIWMGMALVFFATTITFMVFWLKARHTLKVIRKVKAG